jgi:uncharacterized repeat protein (TIGR01451 family)
MLTDTAAVTADGPDPDPGTDHAQATVRILSSPLTITKRASATHVLSGGVVSFCMRVANRSTNAVRNVSVCDRLPTGLLYVSGGTLRGTETCWSIRSLASGHSRTFRVHARGVVSSTRSVTNVATVGAHGVATRSARSTVRVINPVPTFTGWRVAQFANSRGRVDAELSNQHRRAGTVLAQPFGHGGAGGKEQPDDLRIGLAWNLVDCAHRWPSLGIVAVS